MKKFIRYIRTIQKDFPDFNISSIEKIGEGDDSRAFIINQKYIFRFPKRKGLKQQIQREISVLAKIKDLVDLRIPQFEFISPGLHFVGYKIIPGVPLTSEIYHSLNKNQQDLIRELLCNFLLQLHRIDPQILKDCNLETMNLKEEYTDDFVKAKRMIYPHISKSKQKIITQLFIEYLNNPENFNYTPTFIHNDFSKDHILFDIVEGQITGIIDFGDIAFGDPDYDLMYLLDEFGENFLNGILNFYKTGNKKELLNKLRFFSLANKVQIILENRNDENPSDPENGYRSLSSWFQRFDFKNNY